MTTTQTILDSIENRLRELNEEIGTLSAARTALDGDHTRPGRRARRGAAVPSGSAEPDGAGGSARSAASDAADGRRRGRRTRRPKATQSVVVPAGRLELLLSENGELTTTALAERTNGDRDQVLTLLRELEAAGRVRRIGQRRGTRWHAITDDDRIRERAAELAGRRKRSA